MNSIASWSPSQSEPLTVSYMCQRQSSSLMLPSAAAIPPCAATVCERVGKTLVMQAVLRPASAQPTTARRPEPPAPTTTTSNVWSSIGYALPLTFGVSLLLFPFAAMTSDSERDLENGVDARQRDRDAEEGIAH